jgi:hypothetical protein
VAGGRLLHSPCRCERDPDSRGEKLKQLMSVPEERAAAERRAYDAAIAEHPEWVVNALRWPAEEATETSRLTTSAECPSGAEWEGRRPASHDQLNRVPRIAVGALANWTRPMTARLGAAGAVIAPPSAEDQPSGRRDRARPSADNGPHAPRPNVATRRTDGLSKQRATGGAARIYQGIRRTVPGVPTTGIRILAD